jgi:hypothetical protein
MNQNRCDIHDKEIKEVKKDFSMFKVDVNKKIDELIEEVRKPILTDTQWSRVVIGAIIYTVIVVLFIGNTNALSQENKKDIVEINKDYDKIIEYLIEIKEDIGTSKK